MTPERGESKGGDASGPEGWARAERRPLDNRETPTPRLSERINVS
jgi:hypothetical protein